jgi:PAS domain S-box-containing protein
MLQRPSARARHERNAYDAAVRWLEVVQDVRLVLLGALIAVTVALPGIGALARRAETYWWLAAGTATAAVFVASNHVQTAATSHATVALSTRIQLTAVVAWAPIGAMLVEAIRPKTTPRPALILMLGACLTPWLGDIVATDVVYVRPNAFGSATMAVRSGAGFPVLVGLAVLSGAHLIRGLARARGALSTTQRRGSAAIVALLVGAATQDALVFMGQLKSLAVLDLAIGAAALLLVSLLRETVVDQQRHLERSVNDATADLEHAKEELVTALGNLRSMIDAHPGMVLLYRSGSIVSINRAGRDWLGPEVGERVEDLLATRDDDAPRLGERPVTAKASPPYEERFLRHDGTTAWGEVVELTLDYAGEPTTLAIVRDVTERRRLQRRLVSADRLASLGTLAAGVAHEINNPLTYVMSNLELARDCTERDDEIREMLDDACEGARRVSRIVEGLGAFSRRGAPRNVADVDVGSALDSALKLVHNQLRHRAELQVEVAADLPTVPADEAELVQLFVNLLINAGHAIDDVDDGFAHRIDIAAEATDDQVVVTIADTGGGLDEQQRDRLFEPFFTTKAVGKGTGLGLSICHGIIDTMGGRITLDNGPERGAVARVELPINTPPPPTAIAATPAPIPAVGTSALRVLVVDDDLLVGRSVKRLLQEHRVTVVDNGAACLKACESADWDVVLCDVMMPGMSGIEVFAELQRVRPDLAARVVFITGGLFRAEDDTALTASGAPVLYKPLDPSKLHTILAGYLQSVRESS